MILKLQTSKIYDDCEKAYTLNYPIMIEEGGSRCFIGSTLVKTEKGHIPIKDIEKGIKVLSFNELTKKLEYNKILDKFIYEYEHPLVRLKLKDGTTITSTYDHKFLTQGHWTEAYKLAQRRMETSTKHEREIFYKQLRKIKDYELEMYRKRKNNAPTPIKEDTSKKQRRLSKDYDKSKRQVFNRTNSPIGCKSIYPKPSQQTTSKPQERNNKRQQGRKLGMGNKLGKLLAFIQDWTTKTKNKGTKRNEQTNNQKGQRDSDEICPTKSHCKNVSKRIQSISMHNQDNIRTKQKEMWLARSHKRHKNKTFEKARELSEEEILSAELFIKKIPIYDIEVEKTKSYCITKNNYIVHNSSKTYNILIWLIQKSITEWDNQIIDICRKTFPSVRDTVMFDFFEILRKYKIYNESDHNKSESIYKIKNNIFRFFGLDQEQKVRGRKRNILFINEANELNHDEFKQLNQRTTKISIIDYNPSTEFGWYYDIQTQDDVLTFHSTYKDNPFLEERIVKAIERYKETDENYWRVFGLGLRGVSKTTIFSNWAYIDSFEGEGELLYGMDFGFNNPSSLLRVIYHPKGIIVDELLYKSELTSDMIVNELNRIKEKGLIKPTDQIIGDSARPEVIQDIFRSGFNIKGTRKGKDSVLRNINFLKKHKLFITKSSLNLIKEIKSYQWRTDKNGSVLDEPVKLNDHLIDALFYALEDKATDRPIAGGGLL